MQNDKTTRVAPTQNARGSVAPAYETCHNAFAYENVQLTLAVAQKNPVV
jgi:hypothetical protein